MGIRVLSLFDGMSCGQLALQKLGIEVDTYYASEIDKYAIQVAKENFPKTIHVGDVCQLKSEDYKDIDLILAGSPCQGFSFAGKQLAFDDPRSALFFEFVRLLKEIKPKYFLLENVRMKQQFQDVITDQVSACYPDYQGNDLFDSKIKPILINSALLSAQNRLRLYWTNIPNIEQPKDKGIVLKDILIAEEEWQEEVPQYLKNHFHGEPRANQVRHIDVGKSKTLTATMYKGQIQSWIKKDFISPDRVKKYVQDETSEVNDTYNKRTIQGDKSTTIRPNNNTGNIWVNDKAIRETKPKQVGLANEKVKVRKHEVNIPGLQNLLRTGKKESKKTNKQIAKEIKIPVTKVEHWFRTDSSFAIPSDDIWFDLKKILNIDNNEFDNSIMEFDIRDGVYETTQRVYSQEGKSPTLTSAHAEKLVETKPIQVGIAADVNGYDCLKRVYSPEGKSPTVTTCQGGNTEPKVVSGAWRARSVDANGKRVKWKDSKPKQMLELRKDNKSNALSSVEKDNVAVSEKNLSWRKLLPLECERLQTVPDNYTSSVSKTQRFKMLGNGWTIDVIAHILKNMDL